MRHTSQTSLVIVSLLVAGLPATACAEEKQDKSPDQAATESDTKMKGNSCPERLASKKLLFTDLDCEKDQEDADCKVLATSIEELACQCGDPKPTTCQK